MLGKKLCGVVAGVMLAVMGSMLVYGAQTDHRDVVTIYGQKPQLVSEEDMTASQKLRKYFAIIVGDEDGIITNDDIAMEEGWRNGGSDQLLYGDGEELVDYTSDLTRAIGHWVMYEPGYPRYTIVYGNGLSGDTEQYSFVKLPAGMTVEQLGENAKYVIYADPNWKDKAGNLDLSNDDSIGIEEGPGVEENAVGSVEVGNTSVDMGVDPNIVYVENRTGYEGAKRDGLWHSINDGGSEKWGDCWYWINYPVRITDATDPRYMTQDYTVSGLTEKLSGGGKYMATGIYSYENNRGFYIFLDKDTDCGELSNTNLLINMYSGQNGYGPEWLKNELEGGEDTVLRTWWTDYNKEVIYKALTEAFPYKVDK